MDCKKIVKGSTIYLPVNVKGGLLSMGDIHALMGAVSYTHLDVYKRQRETTQTTS